MPYTIVPRAPDAPGPDAPKPDAPGPEHEVSRNARLAMTRARSALVMEHPFFGTLVLRLHLQEDSGCRDLWTDGTRLGFNPAYAASLPEQKLIGAQAHEALHLAFGHHIRRNNRDTNLWNRSCDLCVNQILLDSGFSLPDGFSHDPEYAGLSADDIYTALYALQDQDSNRGATEAQIQSETLREETGDSAEFEGGKKLGGAQEQTGQNTNKPEHQDDGQGPAQTGTPTLSDKDQGQSADKKGTMDFTGEVRDHPGLDGLENSRAQKAAEQEADIALTQAMQRAAHMGSMPAGLARFVKKTVHTALDWRELLRRFIENCADNDYSWSMPSRRYLHQGIYLPSRREARLPHVALAVDCSGSVDETALERFCAELSCVLEAFDTTLTVLFHDTRVQAEHTLGRADLPLRLTPTGGGGTDFRPVCEHIDTGQFAPTCLIWFTDLECDRFPEEPPYPVLWVCSKVGAKEPPFGETVQMTG